MLQLMKSVKKALKRSYYWSTYYFTCRKGSWYPTVESNLSYQDLSSMSPEKNASVTISSQEEEELKTWATTYTRAVRQRTVRQETTMLK